MEPATLMEDMIMEERSEDLIKPTKPHDPTRQISTFLKPSAPSSTLTHNLKPFPFTTNHNNSFNKHLTFRNGFFIPPIGWEDWVNTMHLKYKSTWQKAGIYDAVLNSSYKILKNHDLLLSFVKKWCHETNTFVFVWGEVGITLEDILVIGGFSVLGRNVSDDAGSDVESEKAFGALREAMTELRRSSHRNASQGAWIKMFKDSGSEFEHEAFLALWLSRFVFPSPSDVVVKRLCKVAVCLARGVRLALAPAVLASIYKDLSFLKDRISLDDETPLTVRAPMQLVQIWIWERFPKISPKCEIGCNPRFARWEKTNVCVDDVGLFVDHCAFEDFVWQPYVEVSNENPGFSKVYPEKGRWIVVVDGLDEELESWVRCVRISELVGLDGSCIQQYLPHRVAMQFGMNQDVPADVARVNETREIAWEFYTRSVKDVRLYVPPRLCEPYVTARYLEWRNKATGECNLQSLIGDNETEIHGKDESRSDGGVGIHTLGELEARISKLEEDFAYLKAKKDQKMLM